MREERDGLVDQRNDGVLECKVCFVSSKVGICSVLIVFIVVIVYND